MNNFLEVTLEGSIDTCVSDSGHNNESKQKESDEDKNNVLHLTYDKIDVAEREDHCFGITLEQEYMESNEDKHNVLHLTDDKIDVAEKEDQCFGITLEQEYMEMFPKGTHICKMNCKTNRFKEVEMVGELKLKYSSKEDFKKWLQKFQNITLTTWVTERTKKAKGSKILYKAMHACQHHGKRPQNKNKYKSKSTDCNAVMTVTIARNIEEYRFRGKDRHKHSSEYQTTVMLNFNHNHGICRAEALKYRKPTTEVIKSLQTAFQNGITPGIALTNLKRDLKEQYGASYDLVAADRAICPDTSFVYTLFYKYFNNTVKLRKPRVAARRKKVKSVKAADTIAKTAIERVSNTEYCIQGSGTPGPYFVHTDNGTCTCGASLNKKTGPCKHQAAVAQHVPEIDQFHFSEFLLPLTAESHKATESFQPITQDENEEDSDLDGTQEDMPEPDFEDNCAKIKEAEGTIENALAILKRKLYRALHDDVTTFYPAVKKFEKNVMSVESQGHLISTISTFGKYVGSTSSTAIKRNSLKIPANNTSKRRKV